ncbi:hypothetical protein ERICIII_03552 [Paenibacillus larvae subsp. larvae]|uniref:Uncharacterized protein n=1 Tax=Paenibacillus larvae subsp. larvae TaxID=147375 RepID=A0A2L1U416_9BACL|nr:hypothetical protein ERICIII_03552 [Paenibacillus larvae subsp. larvae]
MRKELKRFIRNGVSETLRYEKAFDEEFIRVSDRIRSGREEMRKASKDRRLVQK